MVVCHDKTVQKSYEKVLHSGDNAIMSVLNMLSLVMLAVQAWNRVGTGTCCGLFSLFYVILAYLLPLALGLFSIKKNCAHSLVLVYDSIEEFAIPPAGGEVVTADALVAICHPLRPEQQLLLGRHVF